MTFGHFKVSFGKRKGKSNDTCRHLPESMSQTKFTCNSYWWYTFLALRSVLSLSYPTINFIHFELAELCAGDS